MYLVDIHVYCNKENCLLHYFPNPCVKIEVQNVKANYLKICFTFSIEKSLDLNIKTTIFLLLNYHPFTAV